MKKIATFVLIYAVFFTSGYFGFFKQTGFDISTSYKSAPNVSEQEYAVKVIDSINVAPVSIVAKTYSQNSANLADCRFSSFAENQNYFQDQGIFDLNQPSGCFNLSIGQAQYFTQRLDVKSLDQLKTPIVVVEFPSSFFSLSLKHFPLPMENARALAVNYFVIFFGQNFGFGVKTAVVKVKPIALKILLSKSFIEFQNFRC